jgi:hypothetical protein
VAVVLAGDSIPTSDAHHSAPRRWHMADGTWQMAHGSQYGWRNFFTVPESRQALVLAIIGEWSTERVLNHIAIGFDREFLGQLEDMDCEYLYFDAFLRNKKRARLINKFFTRDKEQVKSSLTNAIKELVDGLLTLLKPLLNICRPELSKEWSGRHRGGNIEQHLI